LPGERICWIGSIRILLCIQRCCFHLRMTTNERAVSIALMAEAATYAGTRRDRVMHGQWLGAHLEHVDFLLHANMHRLGSLGAIALEREVAPLRDRRDGDRRADWDRNGVAAVDDDAHGTAGRAERRRARADERNATRNLLLCRVGFNIQAAIAVHADIFAGTDRSEGLRCTGPEGIMNV
jgi:hypothetical protein